MSKQYYECHITMLGDSVVLKALVKTHTNWKFSAIDGDPTLGAGIKCYATRHFNAKFPDETVLKFLHETADILEAAGANVIRRKVERVLYDDRSSTVRLGSCNGACP